MKVRLYNLGQINFTSCLLRDRNFSSAQPQWPIAFWAIFPYRCYLYSSESLSCLLERSSYSEIALPCEVNIVCYDHSFQQQEHKATKKASFCLDKQGLGTSHNYSRSQTVKACLTPVSERTLGFDFRMLALTWEPVQRGVGPGHEKLLSFCSPKAIFHGRKMVCFDLTFEFLLCLELNHSV